MLCKRPSSPLSSLVLSTTYSDLPDAEEVPYNNLGIPCAKYSRCNYALCATCQTRKLKHRRDEILRNRSQHHRHLYQIVLVQPDQRHLRPMIRDLYQRFSKSRNRVFWKKNVIGGYCRLHCTRNFVGDVWHAHLHVVAEAAHDVSISVLYDGLERSWHDVLVRKVRPTADDRHRLVNYDMKLGFDGFERDLPLLGEYSRATKNMREFFRFGSWRNTKTHPNQWKALW